MNPETILPCPGCGYNLMHVSSMNNVAGDATCGCTYWAVCLKCHYQGPKADSENGAIRLHNSLCRPQADWSAAAREIANLLGNCVAHDAFHHEKDIEAILVKHAQSQPSAPAVKVYPPEQAVTVEYIPPSSSVPSQEPVANKPSVADGFTAIPINPPDRIVSLMRDMFSDMSKIGDNAVWQVQGWGWMSELYRLIVACERAEASHE